MTTVRPSTSYAFAREGRSFEQELARLRAQVALSWDAELRRLRYGGLCDGQRILELGCGPGFFTERLLEAFPRSELTVLDSDEELLGVARQALAHAGGRVQFVRADASATGLRDDAFDVAVSRYLFQHLPDSESTMVEIKRVLRPGGIHFVIDVDDGLWGLAHPAFPGVRACHLARARAQSQHGGTRTVGRLLWRLMKGAGFGDVDLDLFCYHSDALGVDRCAEQFDMDQFMPLVQAGLLSWDDYLHGSAARQAFLSSPEAFVLMVGFMARGVKP
jgi:SAM-dependent methyltransferase